MILWIIEYHDILNIITIKKIVREGIEVRKYHRNAKLAPEDVVMGSSEDTAFVSANFFPARSVAYEDVYKMIDSRIQSEYEYRYDYYYFKNQLEIARENKNVSVLITGSSYGLWDIDEDKMENWVNLSLGSQDLYYSVKAIVDACDKNPNIKNVVIMCTYYFFYTDLSLCKSEDNLSKISKTYLPVFNDAHNSIVLPPRKQYLPYSSVFNCEKLMDVYVESKALVHYWNDKHIRVPKWELMTPEQKEENAYERASRHNRSLKYTNTLVDNQRLFNWLVCYCSKRNINFIVCSVPTSSLYLKHLDTRFNETFYKVIENAGKGVRLLETNNLDGLEDTDYYDADHLNGLGAAKFTEKLNATIKGFAV